MPSMPPIEGVTTPPDDLTQGVHAYGFRWGPINVTRLCTYRRGERENHVLGVSTDHHKVEVRVSKTGRSVRVWIDGAEVSA